MQPHSFMFLKGSDISFGIKDFQPSPKFLKVCWNTLMLKAQHVNFEDFDVTWIELCQSIDEIFSVWTVILQNDKDFELRLY